MGSTDFDQPGINDHLQLGILITIIPESPSRSPGIRRRRIWLAQGDDFGTFLEDFVATSGRIEFRAGLNL